MNEKPLPSHGVVGRLNLARELKERPSATRTESSGSGPEKTRKGVQSVELAFEILRVFEYANRSLALKEISDLTGMPPSKVHHYLVSLVTAKALRQNRDGTYDIGAFSLHLGVAAIRRIDAFELSAQAASELRNKTGETVFVSVWGSNGPTIIRYFEGSRAITLEVRTGLILPVMTSATGQAFLAWGPPLVASHACEIEKAQPDEIEALKKRTRAAGIAAIDQTLLPRIAGLSVPIFDLDGHLVLTLSIVGWTGEVDTNPDGKIATELRRTTQALSHALGYRAGPDAE